MTKPSRREIMNPPDESPMAIIERVKKLRNQEQNEKTKKEIEDLLREYKRRFLRHSML